MPFVILNAVLALVSIVGGLSLYHELQTTRATLAIVEQQVIEGDKCCVEVQHAKRLLDHYRDLVLQQFEQLQGMRRILTRHRIEWHEEPGVVLEVAP
jgi:hypothetical protein